MDNSFRLKTTVSGHEFDAEGPVEVVTAAFQAFIQAVSSAPAPPTVVPPPSPAPPEKTTGDGSRADTEIVPRPPDGTNIEAALTKIMRVDGRVVSLTVRPRNVDEAALLLLYGQRALRENDSVTGAELIDGLTTTGGLSVGRVDRTMEKLARDNDAIVIGERRAKRYRLTNTGLTKARTIAANLIAIVALDGPRAVEAGCEPREPPAPTSSRVITRAPVLELADRPALHAGDQSQVVRVRSPAGAPFRVPLRRSRWRRSRSRPRNAVQ